MSEFQTPEDESSVEKEKLAIIETAQRGAQYFAPGVLVRDCENRLAQVVGFELVPDDTDYGDEDSSIRKPIRQTNPLITVRYPDGEEKQIDFHTQLVTVYNGYKNAVNEDEPYFDQSHVEIRGHDFHLGELVSFGHQIGTLVVIYPNETVGISAHEVWGNTQTSRHLYQVSVDQIDYIEKVDGDLKKNPDNTIYKPTLG